MLQRVVRLFATGAALAAVLLGLHAGWDFWTVAKRSVASYFVIFAVGGGLAALGRLAVLTDDAKSTTATGSASEQSGTDGTNTAV